jgi:phosphatidylserine/phosphatidylglycerophosphate/cardiolipin synthase-like enzyme
LFSCSAAHTPAPVHAVAASTSDTDPAELAESVPKETTLDHAWIPNVSDVWIDMIRASKRTLDLAEFYVSDEPNTKLHAVLEEIERAAARGVHVRLLCDVTFYEKYPEIPNAWAKRANMEVRRADMRPGVLHAKYFIVDGREVYVGSQNFDWRSLEHIVEMGARIRTPNITKTLEALFLADWNTAGGAPFSYPNEQLGHFEDKIDGGAIIVGASPKPITPESLWDLPRLLDWIGHTTSTLRVSVLTYKIKTRHDGDFHGLDDAVRAAAKRGVHVQLLVSTWNEKDEAVLDLAKTPNVEVRVLDIPKASTGEIPFARVTHAKYALFDEGRAWVGTSNWEGDYFFRSRNVSLFFEHGHVPSDLARAFSDVWSSSYARSPSPAP